MMAELKQIENNECEIVDFPASKDAKKTIKGIFKKTPNNSIKGNPHEVYPIKKKEDVLAMQDYFKNRMDTATNEEDKQINGRNLLMWIMGINLGLRASDLLSLKWGEILYDDGTFQKGIRRTEQKTEKFKTFFLNSYVIEAVTYYINEFHPNLDKDEYVFSSRKSGHIDVDTACRVIKDAAKECGIKVNVGTHTMRKTFGYHWYTAHQNDVKALNKLQNLFNHSSELVTLKYIGMEDEENEQYYNDLTW